MLTRKKMLMTIQFDIVVTTDDHCTASEIQFVEDRAVVRIADAIGNFERLKNVTGVAGSYSIENVKVNP